MPRTYKCKTNRSNIDECAIKQAIRDVTTNVCGLMEAVRRHGIKKSTLQSRIKTMRSKAPDGIIDLHSDSGNESEDHTLYSSKYTVNQVFNTMQELEMTNYIKKTSNLNYGLTYRHIRLLAYDFAKSNNLAVPPSWNTNEIAGKPKKIILLSTYINHIIFRD